MMNYYITLKILYLASVYGVAPELALATAKVESSLNPYVYNKNSHATGLFQIRPEYSAYTVEELKDIETNIRQGILRIKLAKRQCFALYGDIEYMRCYNQGMVGARRDKEAGNRYIFKLRNKL